MRELHKQMALHGDNTHNYLPSPSNILGYSSSSHGGSTLGGPFSLYSGDSEEGPRSDGHSYMHNSIQGLSSIGPPPPPPLPAFMSSSCPSLLHIDSELSPRNLYRSEHSLFSSHQHQHHLHQQQTSQTGSRFPTWSAERDLMSLPSWWRLLNIPCNDLPTTFKLAE